MMIVLPSAGRRFTRFVWYAAGGVFGLIVVMVTVAPRSGPGAVVGGVVGLMVLAAVATAWRSVAKVNLTELEAGYTTLRLTFGGFGWGRVRQWRSGHRIPWDYAGTWVLDPTSGAVVSAPDPAFDPPGLYPSPTRTGRLELWTGAVWTGETWPHPPVVGGPPR